MTPNRTERVLATWLAETAQPQVPDYFDDLIGRTGRTRQRPAWAFPGRWLPIALIPRTPQWASPVPLRVVLVMALIAVLAALAVLGGSPMPRPLPPPFGPATNGRILLGQDGDIVTLDPVTGARTVVVGGPELDQSEMFSRDGTRILFGRDIDGRFLEKMHAFVVNADGTGLKQISHEPFNLTSSAEFSPDGRSVLVVAEGSIWIVASDGSGGTRFNIGMAAEFASFRPDGNALLFTRIDAPRGVYVMDVEAAVPRPVETVPGAFAFMFARWSPDGRSIVYSSWNEDGLDFTARVHIIGADGTGSRVVGAASESSWEAAAAWSNRGDRLVMMRGYDDSFADVRAVTVNLVDGTTVESEPLRDMTDCCWSIEWAPDDTTVLITPLDPTGAPAAPVLFDPVAGTFAPISGAAPGWARWQRVATPEP